MVNRLDIEHSEHNIQNYTVSCNIIIEYKFIGGLQEDTVELCCEE